MRYKITHSTSYTYGEPVKVCHNLIMLTPRPTPHLQTHSHRLVIRPTPEYSARRKDDFGNFVHCLSIEESHRRLSITATSRVTVDEVTLPIANTTPPWEKIVGSIADGSDPNWFHACRFLFDSSRVRQNAKFRDYAQGSFTKERPILESVLDLTSRIHRDFKYDTNATQVDTLTEDAFELRRGVCQDFAHVQIACFRSLGLPARYVSGYLRTIPPPGKPRLVGVDQSHAWVSVYCGPTGWIDVDPTNDTACRTDHIPLAFGRDYKDVTPVRGVFLGGGRHTLKVEVDVCPLDLEDGQQHEDDSDDAP